jgi:hypothetical protein
VVHHVELEHLVPHGVRAAVRVYLGGLTEAAALAVEGQHDVRVLAPHRVAIGQLAGLHDTDSQDTGWEELRDRSSTTP